MTIGPIGQPGERQTSHRDIQTEVMLPLAQSGASLALGILMLLLGLGMLALVGRVGSWLAITAALWLWGDRVVEWITSQARRQRVVAAVVFLGDLIPWVWLCLGYFAMRYVMPWVWDFDLETGAHALRIVRAGMEPVVLRVSLLARVMMFGVLSVAIWLCAEAIEHFRTELQIILPAAAVNYPEVGLDVRKWGPREQLANGLQKTVRVETVKRLEPGRRAILGTVYPGDQITIANVMMTREQWKTVAQVALRPDLEPTREQMVRMGFGQKEWQRVRDALVQARLMEPAGQGDNAENAGYRFTLEGIDFFKERRWLG